MNRVVHTGDVFVCKFGDRQGSLQSGTRPCIIVDNNMACVYSPCIHIVPLSTQDKHMTLHYPINEQDCECLKGNSVALCEQYTLVDKSQLGAFIGTISKGDLANIADLCKQNLPFTYKRTKGVNE